MTEGSIQNVLLLLSLREACPRGLRGTSRRWPAWQRLQDGRRVVDAERHPVHPSSRQEMDHELLNTSGPADSTDIGRLGRDSSSRGGVCTPSAHGTGSATGIEQGTQGQAMQPCTCFDGGPSTFQQGSNRTCSDSDRQLQKTHTQTTRQTRHLGLDASTGLNIWAERDSLRHYVASYCPLQPAPRSTIAAAFSPDGTSLASTHGDHTVKVVSCSSAKCLRTLTGHRRTPWVVRYHPAAPDIVASGSLDHEVRLWSLSTAQCFKVHAFYRPIASLAFHARGDLLAVASGRHLYIWEHTKSGDDGQPVIVLKTRRSLRAVHFHPHGAPLLLTAEVNALESAYSAPSTALSSGYLDYPPPTVHFMGAEEPTASAASVQLPPWRRPAVQGGPFWSGEDGALAAGPPRTAAAPQRGPSFVGSVGAAGREQQVHEAVSPLQGRGGRRQPAGGGGSAGVTERQQHQTLGSGQLPSGQSLGGGGPGAWSNWLWSMGAQASAGLPLLSQLAPAVASPSEAAMAVTRERTAMAVPSSGGLASGSLEQSRDNEVTSPAVANNVGRHAMPMDQAQLRAKVAAGAALAMEPERPAGGSREFEGQDTTMRLRDDGGGALQPEVAVNLVRASESGWRLFQGRGPGAGHESMAVDSTPESPSLPHAGSGVGQRPNADAEVQDPAGPVGLVEAELLPGPSHEEVLFKEDEGEDEEWEDRIQAEGAPGRHVGGVADMVAGPPGPRPGGASTMQASLGEPGSTDCGVGSMEQDRGVDLNSLQLRDSRQNRIQHSGGLAERRAVLGMAGNAVGLSAGDNMRAAVAGTPASFISPHQPATLRSPDPGASGHRAMQAASWSFAGSLPGREQRGGGSVQGLGTQLPLPRQSFGGSRRVPEAGDLGSASLLVQEESLDMHQGGSHNGHRGSQDLDQEGPLPGVPGDLRRFVGAAAEAAERDSMAAHPQHLPGRMSNAAWRQGQQPQAVRGGQPLSLLSAVQQQLLEQHHQVMNPEVPCTVRLKLWRHSEDSPKRELDPATSCRLTISHAVLCSEMGAHFSPCGRFLAACVACIPATSSARGADLSSPAEAAAMAAVKGQREPAVSARAGPTSPASHPDSLPSIVPAPAAGSGRPWPLELGQDWQDMAVRAHAEAADLGAAVAAVRLEQAQEPQVLGTGPGGWNTHMQRAGQPPRLGLGGVGTRGGYAQRLALSTSRGQGRQGLATGPAALGDTFGSGAASTQGSTPPPPLAKALSIVYELRIFSVEGPLFGKILASRGVRAAHCLTSIQFSPTSSHLLLAYGRRHHSLLRSIVVDGRIVVPIYTILEVYRVADMSLVHVLTSAEDEVNVASFHPTVGSGFVYGTKEGKLRLFQHSRQASPTTSSFGLTEGINLTDEHGSPWWASLDMESGAGEGG